MGRSAKVHKRLKRAATVPIASSSLTAKAQAAQAANKKTAIKHKATPQSRGKETIGHVLGGADYVSMMKGRRKAKEEAKKLTDLEN